MLTQWFFLMLMCQTIVVMGSAYGWWLDFLAMRRAAKIQ